MRGAGFIAGACTGALVSIALLVLLDPLLPPALWAPGTRHGSEVVKRDWFPYRGGPITIDMNKLPPRDIVMPQGGSYVHGGDVANLTSGLNEVLRVTAFDASSDAVVMDGQPLNGRDAPEGWLLAEANDSAILRAGDGAVVLRGVSLALWAKGAAQQMHGTAGDDTLTGTRSGEALIPGGGIDLVIPAGGDDWIGFTSGDKIIADAPPNEGLDTLDLRRFVRTDLQVTAEGDDLVVATPDGWIRLEGQLGAPDGNIETVLLARDDMLDAGSLLALAGK